jgi:hypothetical protein
VRADSRAIADGIARSDETSEVGAAIKAVAAGTDWISPRLACILGADDAPARLEPAGNSCAAAYAPGMPMKSVARRMGISEETVKQYKSRNPGEVRPSRAFSANENTVVLSSRRGRASSCSLRAADPPLPAAG